MGSPKKAIAYRYDSVGNRVGMTDPDGGRFTYAYDAVNRISHLVNPQGDRTTYSYDPGGRRTVKKLANGTRASFSYDTASNLTRLANLKSDGTTISSFDYRYDRVGNRTAVLEADGSRVTWSYDDTYQLAGEHRTGSHAYRNTFAYDPAGNRTLKNEDGARTTYSYDAANQLTTAVDASGTTTYTFDEDGNQKVVEAPNGDRTTNTWDGENRMTLVQQPDGNRNTMAYEPGGLRVKLEESTGTKKFVWDNQNYLAETDENDDTQVVYTNEPRVYGNLVSQRRGSDSHWYHFDAIGSTRELTDNLESVTDTRLYDGWGSIIAETGDSATPFMYVARLGYCSDRDSSRTYVRARSYMPHLSRWLSLDPLSATVDTPFEFQNWYSYCLNTPLSRTDPSGERCIVCTCEQTYFLITPFVGPSTFNTSIECNFGTIQTCCWIACNRFDQSIAGFWRQRATDIRWSGDWSFCDNAPLKTRTDLQFNCREYGDEADYRHPRGGNTYKGGYRHCAAACCLVRQYGMIPGNWGVLLYDWWAETPGVGDSDSDMNGERIGLCLGHNSPLPCDEACLNHYP